MGGTSRPRPTRKRSVERIASIWSTLPNGAGPLLTFDDDFPRLVATTFAEYDHAGVIYVSQHGRNVGELVRRIDAALQRHADRDIEGEVIYP
ncbi:MAG: hypothetical protein QXG03_11970 [Halalkalicoccus sp.]